MSEFITRQTEVRNNLIMQVREVIDFAESEDRGLDAEELRKIEAIEADIAKADEAISVAQRSEERKLEAAVAAKGFIPAVSERSASDILREVAQTRSAHTFEKRTLTPSTNTVPKSFYDQVFDVARLAGPMLETSEVINTTSGEDLTIPTLTAYSTAALTAAGSAISASEPTYSSITLGAKKYGFLIQAANELVTDAGFDLAGHLARQAGNAIGFAVNSALTNGTGTTVPNGIVTAAGSGVTGGTGVSGAFTYENLIDLAYGIADGARVLPNLGFQMSKTGIAVARKLKDSVGNYIWTEGAVGGQPATLLGYSVYENPAVAAVATGAKSVLFGHLTFLQGSCCWRYQG